MTKVTVVIPVYKVEPYLPACLDSVLGQSLRELEVIAIDDASPDRCPEILDAYAAKDERVTVIHLPENHQQGYGRNRGLERARGKYVYFLDSDDMITPTALEELYDLAERDRLDGIFFDSQVLFESAELERKNAGYAACRTGRYEPRVYGGQELLDAFIAQREWDCYVQREFWRRDHLLDKGISFPEGTEHEDEYFAFAAILLAERMRCVPGQYFIRRYRENSVMTRKAHPKDFHGYFVNYCRMIDLVQKMNVHSPGADANILHMYERMLQFFPLFRKQEQPEAWFRTEEELRTYKFFTYSQELSLYYKARIDPIREQIPDRTHIWIYGAGAVGKKTYRAFEDQGYIVEGFLVTSPEGNPDVLFGREVRSIDQVKPEPNHMAVVAVSGRIQGEIERELAVRGWKYLVFPLGR